MKDPQLIEAQQEYWKKERRKEFRWQVFKEFWSIILLFAGLFLLTLFLLIFVCFLHFSMENCKNEAKSYVQSRINIIENTLEIKP